MTDQVLEYGASYAASNWEWVWHPVSLGKTVEHDGKVWVVTGITRRPGGKVYLASYATTLQVDPEQIGMRWATAKQKTKRKHAHA